MTSSAGPDPALMQMTRHLFAGSVGIGVTDPRALHPPLHDSERAATPGMVPRRLREFAAGRHAARQALNMLGFADQAIPMGEDRAPIWPKGLQGSLTHCAAACIAVVARGPATLGIDLEPDAPLAPDLTALICTPIEQDWLRQQPPEDRGRLARVIFSAKESVYKAQYPFSKEILDFADVVIAPYMREGRFSATFHHANTSFPAGARVLGRVAINAGLILTGIAIAPPPKKTALP
jgi:4'-phosphopantetheinyl transferase EntD